MARTAGASRCGGFSFVFGKPACAKLRRSFRFVKTILRFCYFRPSVEATDAARPADVQAGPAPPRTSSHRPPGPTLDPCGRRVPAAPGGALHDASPTRAPARAAPDRRRARHAARAPGSEGTRLAGHALGGDRKRLAVRAPRGDCQRLATERGDSARLSSRARLRRSIAAQPGGSTRGDSRASPLDRTPADTRRVASAAATAGYRAVAMRHPASWAGVVRP